MNDVDVARDDLALDALAAGRLPAGGDEALGLLHALRTGLDAPAATAAPPTTPIGSAPAGAAPVVVPLRPRRGPLSLVALSAAAGLVLGAVLAGAVVSADEPGQLLYAAHKAVLGDPKAAERVTRLLDDAAEALAEGDRAEARRRLDRAAERIGDVEDPDERTALVERLGRLRVLAAGPAPTAPPAPSASASPGNDPTPEPTETETPDDDDNSGKGSSSSGSGSDGSGGDGRSDSSGKGSDDVLKTLDPDDSSGRGGGDD